MTAPNIAAPTAANIKSHGQVLTTSMADVLVCAANHAYNVDSIFVCSSNTTVKRSVTIVVKKSGVEYNQTYQTKLGIGATFPPLFGKPCYLEEGDSIRALASANTDVTITVNYLDVS